MFLSNLISNLNSRFFCVFLQTGDVIVLVERVNEEWFKGEINKRIGRFPAAFVEILIPLP